MQAAPEVYDKPGGGPPLLAFDSILKKSAKPLVTVFSTLGP